MAGDYVVKKIVARQILQRRECPAYPLNSDEESIAATTEMAAFLYFSSQRMPLLNSVFHHARSLDVGFYGTRRNTYSDELALPRAAPALGPPIRHFSLPSFGTRKPPMLFSLL